MRGIRRDGVAGRSEEPCEEDEGRKAHGGEEKYLRKMNHALVVVVVGDEILQGRRTEANAAWISSRAAEMGLHLREVRIVSDEVGALAEALRALEADGVDVVVTGGLGPTRDDRTRSEVADTFGRALLEHPDARRFVEASYARRSIPLDPLALVQALLPDGAEMVSNPVGTAPGFRMRRGGFSVTCLPGVPREMRAMWESDLVAHLAPCASAPGIARMFTHGLGESKQEALMASLPLEGVEFCSLPGPWGVELQCRVPGGDPSTRVARAEEAREEVARLLGDAVVRPLGTTMLDAFVQGLRRRGWRVALAESCTAGLAAARLADLPGVSDVFVGGVVAYANDVKIAQLGVAPKTLVEHGAVSESTALEMARGARRLLSGTGIGLAVTGIAGPDGGTPGKPVGTVWLAVSGPEGDVAEQILLAGARDLVRERAAWRLLGLGWRTVR